jgi:polyisoprenoid-binding protein YceI
MNSNIKKIGILITTSIVFFFTNLSVAQQFNLNNQESTLNVLGTSSLHDWEITTESQNGKIVFKDMNTSDIEKLDISVKAESLKSGKNGMDKNTYKALKTDDFETIDFELIKLDNVVKKAEGKFTVKTTGDLTVSGVKKRISLNFEIDTSSAKSIILTGEKNIKMTDFNIEPPKALFGTITTGDEITIKFKSIFK